ncbi:MAG: PHP domain-containing protein [Sphingomonadaceae bacterium]
MLKNYVADLHVHTLLSPCADYRMVPYLIIERATEVGVDLLGITDHNSGENAAAVVEAASRSGVAVLPGMEVESREGVHVLTLFDGVQALQRWQDTVYAALPPRENAERVFGAQLVVDAEGQLKGVNRRLLITAVDLSLDDIVGLTCPLGGICVPAHVDRPANGLLSVLGFLPAGLDAPALEVSPLVTPEGMRKRFPELADRTLITSSDAHSLKEIGRATTSFLIAAPTVAELALACRGEQGRGITGWTSPRAVQAYHESETR